MDELITHFFYDKIMFKYPHWYKHMGTWKEKLTS